MGNGDFFNIHFATGEHVSQEMLGKATVFEEIVRQLDRNLTALYDSGLQGRFLAALMGRSSVLLNELRRVTDELAEAGRDLQTVVEWARLLDAQTALTWMRGDELWLPDSGGGAERLDHITTSINRLQLLQHTLREQLGEVRRQKDSRLNALLGLRDDYEAMENQLEDTLARNEARVAQLQLEQATLEQQALDQSVDQDPAQTESGFGKILREQPRFNTVADTPPRYTDFRHRQYATGDTYGCVLYAQASVLEAMGFDFEETLNAGRAEGVSEGWYDNTSADGDPASGSQYWALGDMFESNSVPFERMGGTTEWSGSEIPDQNAALQRLESELQHGHFPVVSFMATEVALYKGGNVNGHTVWVTGIERDATGQIESIVVNCSHFGKQITIPANEFLNGWGPPHFNYQAVFARRPGS